MSETHAPHDFEAIAASIRQAGSAAEAPQAEQPMPAQDSFAPAAEQPIATPQAPEVRAHSRRNRLIAAGAGTLLAAGAVIGLGAKAFSGEHSNDSNTADQPTGQVAHPHKKVVHHPAAVQPTQQPTTQPSQQPSAEQQPTASTKEHGSVTGKTFEDSSAYFEVPYDPNASLQSSLNTLSDRLAQYLTSAQTEPNQGGNPNPGAKFQETAESATVGDEMLARLFDPGWANGSGAKLIRQFKESRPAISTAYQSAQELAGVPGQFSIKLEVVPGTAQGEDTAQLRIVEGGNLAQAYNNPTFEYDSAKDPFYGTILVDRRPEGNHWVFNFVTNVQ